MTPDPTPAKTRTPGGTKPIGLAEPKPTKTPRLLPLELVLWEGHLSCAYLNDYRVVGGKPWGGGRGAYIIDIRTEQLQHILQRAAERGSSSVTVEVYRHPDGEYAAYIDNELMLGKRQDSRCSRPRRVGSTLVMLYREVKLTDFARAHPALKLPS